MNTGTILNQGAANKGQTPVGCEEFLWTAAFVAREVIVLAPRGLTKSECIIYYGEMAKFLVGATALLSIRRP